MRPRRTTAANPPARYSSSHSSSHGEGSVQPQRAAKASRAGKSSTATSASPLVVSITAGPGAEALVKAHEILGPEHKVARGRGRRKQLEQMTEKEKEAERELRMEKMRIAARECRLRKKSNVKTLEATVQAFSKKDRANRAVIASLQEEVRRLQFNLEQVHRQQQAVVDRQLQPGHREQAEQAEQQHDIQYARNYQHQQYESGELDYPMRRDSTSLDFPELHGVLTSYGDAPSSSQQYDGHGIVPTHPAKAADATRMMIG